MNLGSLRRRQDRLDDAAEHYARALALRPDLAEAHCNLGTVREAEGRPDAALDCYRRALALNPDFAEAHNNAAVILIAQGDLPEALAHLQQAISLRPNFVEGYNNLARVMRAGGDVAAALDALGRALSIRETAETKSLAAGCLANMRALPPAAGLRHMVLRALKEHWGRANDLAPAAAMLLKRDAPSAGWIVRAVQAWPSRLTEHQLFGERGLAAANEDELLIGLLQSARACDVAVERFLTAARRALLDRAIAMPADAPLAEGALQFAAALARQCFINEHVFAWEDDELRSACDLRDRLIAAMQDGRNVSALWVCAVAAYFPLDSLPVADVLLGESWPDAVNELLVQQVREPRAEREVAANVACLTPIEDATSIAVRNQYEANPYPRWMAADSPAPVRIVEYLRRLFPAVEFDRPGGTGPLEVLVAGCGTGQHAIETAQRLAGARVLAVDLSLASLSYAIRKTRELGLTNIDYGQGDILALGALGRSFDVIEASGVLHHLADPLAGWRVLGSLLRPAGVMALGLYSAVARADIVAARHFIAEHGYQATADDIRRCRQELIADGRFDAIVTSGDFFSTSSCRDLLFHAQEHRMTLPQIASFLSGSGLRFLGFEVDAGALNRYRARFPADRATTDLVSWHEFERENPATFAGMYQFWVQRTA
jgi:SAM-dependent methyltransferase